MGVTYKLKQEVIDCILNEKKADPQISCRILSEIIDQKYSLKISKSSINAILKSALLSSPIGRRSIAKKKTFKFKIPDEKKNQLFGPQGNSLVESITPTDSIASKNPPSPPPSQIKEKSVAPEDPIKVTLKEDLPQTKKAPPPIVSPPVEIPMKLEERPVSSSEIIEKEEKSRPAEASPVLKKQENLSSPPKLLPCLGAFFLKAAEWEVSSEPIIPKLVSKFLKPGLGLDHRQVKQLSEAFLFSEIFGLPQITRPSEIIKEALCVLQNTTEYRSELLPKFLEGVMDLKKFSIRMANEIPLIFTEISKISLFFDNHEINLSPNFELNVQSHFSSPLNKVLTNVTHQFITNVQTICLKERSTEFSPKVIKHIEILLKEPPVLIKKIGIIDVFDQELASFAAIPHKHRHALIGVSTDFPFEKVGNVQKSGIMQDELGQEFTYKEKEAFLSNNYKIRAVFISNLTEGSELIILSNLSEEVSAEKMIKLYLGRHPFFKGQTQPEALKDNINFNFFQDLMEQRNKALWEDFNPTFQDNCFVLLRALNWYCHKHFFPPELQNNDFSTTNRLFYALPGHVSQDKDSVKILFKLPEGLKERSYVKYAVIQFNRSDIRNFGGKKFIMDVIN